MISAYTQRRQPPAVKEQAVSKVSLATLSVAALIAATIASADALRAQSTTPIEYLRVSPYYFAENSGQRIHQRTAYRGCLATTGQFNCREFGAASDSALLGMLATLGSEGWELVSVVDEEDPARNGLTYFFKRPARVTP
jgi:hypothetical protein